VTVTSVEDGDVISIDIDHVNCTNCKTCSEICPKGLYSDYIFETKDGDKKSVQRVPPDKFYECSGCEICADRCPEAIIKIQKLRSKE
jgi:Pyruvate/2-oxoacid:ferredoxin oxidoreductase delta subunit